MISTKNIDAKEGAARKKSIPQKAASVVAMVTKLASFFLAIVALYVSVGSYTAARNAAESAKEANRIAEIANTLSARANKTAKEANELAEKTAVVAYQPVFRFETANPAIWGPKDLTALKKDRVTRIYNEGAPVYNVHVTHWFFMEFEIQNKSFSRRRMVLVHDSSPSSQLTSGEEIIEGVTGNRTGLVAVYYIGRLTKEKMRQLTNSFVQFADSINGGKISEPAFSDKEVNDGYVGLRDAKVNEYFLPQEYVRITYEDRYKKKHVVYMDASSSGMNFVTEEQMKQVCNAYQADLSILPPDDVEVPKLLAGWCTLFDVTPSTIILPSPPEWWLMRDAHQEQILPMRPPHL